MLFKIINISANTLLPPIKRAAKQVTWQGILASGRGRRAEFCSKTDSRSGAVRTVDLRSDTLTKPGLEMRQAMAQAEVGDDGFGEDPTVNELQKRAADMFGMEASLLVPSGTMGNLIAVMVHCRQRGHEMILGDLSHMQVYEQGGSAQLAGVHSTTVSTLPDGTFNLAELEAKIRHGSPDAPHPCTRLVCVENTHNVRGGRVLPLSFLCELRSLADRYGLAVHMDGARLMNAAVAQGISPSAILRHCHTVCVALSKGLGAPAGTVLAGPQDFVQRAIFARRALGGAMRQSGILAAAGMLALTDMVGQLEEDHRRARSFAEALQQCHPPLYHVDMAAVETNIVRFTLRDPRIKPTEFCKRASEVCDGETWILGQGVRVLMIPHPGGAVRAVWYLGISDDDTQIAIKKLHLLAQRYMEEGVRAQ